MEASLGAGGRSPPRPGETTAGPRSGEVEGEHVPLTAIFKVCFVGPESVGKTSLVRRFSADSFELEYIRTIGVAISKRQMPADPLHPGEPVTFVLWDIMGDYDFFSEVADAYLQGANGILAVMDLTRPETLEGLRRWGETVRAKLPRAEGIIAGNKADLVASRRVTPEEVNELAGHLGWSFTETSALTGTGVEESFERLRTTLLRRRHTSPGT